MAISANIFLEVKDSDGVRLDIYITKNVCELSRSQVQALIKNGQVLLNGQIPDKSSKVWIGDSIAATIPPAQNSELCPQDIPLEVLFEDEYIIVLNKQAGLVVHPAAGNRDGTMVNALLAHCPSLFDTGEKGRPGIVHRLDKNTSGIMAIAKNNESHHKLAKQFEKHSIVRKYISFCWGRLKQASGVFEGQIGRSRQNRQKMSITQSGGKYSCTCYNTIERYDNLASKVECTLKTGRTHQVRVHMQALGNPIIGDTTYGRARNFGPKFSALGDFLKIFGRHALHAYYLSFTHPKTGEVMTFKTALPSEMLQLEQTLKGCKKT
ncbi:MAG: RluA family pseudouridine synthase [Holosporales bacterium]|jgi:23S rRNA pseudouridine1911/1915/1917 synthase|nr:RluA family pseudouridine synthase [Holosporales bacterium]